MNSAEPYRTSKTAAKPSLDDQVASALAWLKSPQQQGHARRHGAVRNPLRPRIRRDGGQHQNARQARRAESRSRRRALGHRLVRGSDAASFVDDPALVTAAQMDRWCRDFDNWAICDTVCFALFDRTLYAWPKVAQWSGRRDEFVKRAAFALLWGLTMHDKRADDAPFVESLHLVERAADDDRNFVKKSVNMALRAIGKRSPALHAAALAVAKRLALSEDASSRWIGKDAVRELESAGVRARLAGRAR
jgi:3-methyladenine DNA glycosylase AlkD